MSEVTHKTYTFSTFQELFDRVPANRMEDCMKELAAFFADAKGIAETAINIGGGLFPEGMSLFTLPQELEWMDDGKREITMTLQDEEGSVPSITLKTTLP